MKPLQVIGALFIGAAIGTLLLGGIPFVSLRALSDIQAGSHPMDWDMRQDSLAIMWGERGMVAGSILGALLGLAYSVFRPPSRALVTAIFRGAGVAGLATAMLVLGFEVFGPYGRVTLDMGDWRQLYLPTLFYSLQAAALGGVVAAAWQISRSHIHVS